MSPANRWGLRFLDVSNRQSPTEAGAFEAPRWATGVTIAGNHAYVSDGDFGLFILDISDPTTPTPAFTGGRGLAKPNSVAVAGTYAYAVDSREGLRVFDVSDPARPSQVARVRTPGSGKKVLLNGNFAYVADGSGGLRVYDVSDPRSPNEAAVYGRS